MYLFATSVIKAIKGESDLSLMGASTVRGYKTIPMADDINRTKMDPLISLVFGVYT